MTCTTYTINHHEVSDGKETVVIDRESRSGYSIVVTVPGAVLLGDSGKTRSFRITADQLRLFNEAMSTAVRWMDDR